ncbi:MAG: tRNA (guanosine(37)-N1)-methyltransferase TrmD [Holosporaceae bacterium]|jgi:tRNA (guanine37-N1)-methyltransferase|nr:tRNA (guanosine(37)-N1)-methyltransferase TrmD [Holosporaceae bacterium]
MWQANVFTVFPEAFPGSLGVSVIGKALKLNKWNLNIIDLKQFPAKLDRIDFPPFGGGAGMVLSPLTFEMAFNLLGENQKNMRKIYFSPRGRQFNQTDIQDLADSHGVTMLCGRYEGVDQRILDYYSFDEISIGDFVLSGGEVAAMAIIESCVRLLPNIVGNTASICDDSFKNCLLEYNQYTKPQVFNGLSVPDVILSGNHEKIDEFRASQSKKITQKRRTDLWKKYIAMKMKSIRKQKNTF